MGLVFLASPGPVEAQVLTRLELSLSNPGARSLGLGGAFVALADDATAAYANPAGLTQITRPEISLEGRAWSYDIPYTSGGRAWGRPTGLGIDTSFGPVGAESSADPSGLSFASFVYPWRRWAFALYQHQLMRYEVTQEIQGIFFPGPGPAGALRGPIEQADWELEIVSRGLAVAVEVDERLSLGLTLTRHSSDGRLIGREYLPDDDSFEGYFSPSSFLPERLTQVVVGRIDESDWAFGVGFLWDVSERWRLGGSWRQGPDLKIEATGEPGPASPLPPEAFETEIVSRWSLPDVFSLGVAYRSKDGRWTAGMEWDWVEYSVILDSLDPNIVSPEDRLDNGSELRLGVEYTLLHASPIAAFRLGFWRDPDHRVRSESADPFLRAELPPGEDQLHFAAGVGLAFESFQIDLGVDLSDTSDTASLSAVYSF